MTKIRVIPNEGIRITGKYLNVIVVSFKCFDSTDKDLNMATLVPKVHGHYYQESSDTIALKAN